MSSGSAISTASMVSNPSSEDTIDIVEENVRLKNLLETGLFKSLKGHQTLCDILINRSSTGIRGKKESGSLGTSTLMGHTGNLNSTRRPFGFWQKCHLLILILYLAMIMFPQM